jgi:RNA polymerase sigma-70 factor (TIGR02943 family)
VAQSKLYHSLKYSWITGVFPDFPNTPFRGTLIAIRAIAMDTTAETRPNAKSGFRPPSAWVDDHADYLFNFAIGQMHDTHTAEDLVQETFLAALKSLGNFSGRSSDRTWLVGILRHKICDHLRRACRERAMRCEPMLFPTRQDWDESVSWVHQVAAESQSPSKRIELAEFRQHLERAIGTLPPRIAQVFQLYEIEERSNQEVCAQLNISESNLWVMLHRARKQLRAHLSAWWFGEPEHEASAAYPDR